MVLSQGTRLAQVQLQLQAQLPPPPQTRAPGPVGDTTLAAQLATITTDTGAFAPGHRDFTRYTNPEMCLAAAVQARAHALVSVAAQTSGISDLDRNQNDLEDTLGLGATGVVARACGARFTATVPQTPARPRELRTLFLLAIYEQNAPVARQMLAALLAQKRSESDSLDVYRYGLGTYLGFGWLTAATTLIQQVDVPGANASQRHLAMLLWSDYVTDRWYRDLAHHSRYGPAIDRIIQLYDSLPPNLTAKSNELAWFAIDNTWHWRALLDLEAGLPIDSIYPIARIQQHEIDGMDDTLRARMLHEHHAEVEQHRTVEGLMFNFEPLIPPWASYPLKHGSVAPRLTATYWYPPPQRPASDTLRPTPNKVNVLCKGGVLTSDFSQGGARTAFVELHEMRRWLATYGADNLEITLVHPARGFDALDFYMEYTGFVYWPSLAAEGAAWRWYVQDFQQLPITVAVQAVTDRWQPAPDGRRVSDEATPFRSYFGPTGQAILARGDVACVVIDRAGRITYATGGPDAYGTLADESTSYMLTDLALRATFQHERAR